MTVALVLIAWPVDSDAGGPRLLGRLEDADLIDEVRKRLLERRRASIVELERGVAAHSGLHLVPGDGTDV